MTAEASRKISPTETMDAFGPPGSATASSKFSATPPDAANMAALLMSMMERMERSERRTAAVIGEMQSRLAELSRHAEAASAEAEKAIEAATSASTPVTQPAHDNVTAPVEAKNGADKNTFALLEQRLSAFQMPTSPETPAATETAAPAYRTAAQAAASAIAETSIPQRRSDDAGREPGDGETSAAQPAPAEVRMFMGPAIPASPRAAAEPEPVEERHAQSAESPDCNEFEVPLAAQFKAGLESVQKPAMGAAVEPPPIVEHRRPPSIIDARTYDQQPFGHCRFEDQFDVLAARLESALSPHQSGTGVEALSEKLDAVSRELADALAQPAEALHSIEHQLTDIARSFGQTEQRFKKVNDIESHLSKLIGTLNQSPGMIDRIAESTAARVLERGGSASNDSLVGRLDAMHAELTAFDSRSRAQSDRLSGVVDTMQRMLGNLSDSHGAALRAQAAQPRAEEKRIPSAAPIAAAGGNLERAPATVRVDADFDDEPAQSETRNGASTVYTPSLRERLGATIPDFQPSAAESKPKRAQDADRSALGGIEKKDDFIAAARKAAQAAAARANEKSKPSAQMREAAQSQPRSSKAAETHLSRPRPILVIAAAVLLIASAALLYTRLQSKPSAPAAPAIEQQQGEGKPDEPAKSSNAQPESMLALGSRGVKAGDKLNDRLNEEAQPASISKEEAAIGSVVVKSLGDDAAALNSQVALPPAMVGPYSMRLAAARGESVAQYVVASRFAEGKGVPQNSEEAARWYARAAAQGHAPAQYRLAVLFERGEGVEKDAARARVWYTRAADKGNVKAMHNLAVTMSGPDATPDDHAIAAQWFARAAEQGLADSQFNLAIFFENGLGLNRDMVEAYKWYSLAANQMDIEAAKRRDLLKAQLGEKALPAADKAVKAWRPVPPKKEANEVETLDATWGETAAEL